MLSQILGHGFNDPITHIFYVNHKWPIMKALVYHGPRNVQIDDKPGPSTQHPQDAILRVTSTAICDSDLCLVMKLDEAPKGYEIFDKKEDVTKIVFKP